MTQKNKIRVLVNGIEPTSFYITINKDSDVHGFCGDIQAVFADGSELKGRIRKEILIPQLHPLQHLYDLDIGKVSVEYIDDEFRNLV